MTDQLHQREGENVSEPGTICKCGLAQSYHGPNPPNLADHEWTPRYDADSYAFGVAAGSAAALEEVAEQVRNLKRVPMDGNDHGFGASDLVTRRAVLALLSTEEGS